MALGNAPVQENKQLNGKPASAKDWFAQIPRQVILHQIATADCLKDRIYWALILYSWCAPDRREGCYLKNEEGRLMHDEHGNEIPLRPKHLREFLDIPFANGPNLHRAIRQLRDEFSLHISEDGIWYPVPDPVRLKSVSLQSVINGQTASLQFPLSFLSVRIPEKLLTSSAVINALNESYKSIHEAFVNDNTALHKSYRERWKSAINAAAILIEEEKEELEEKKDPPPPTPAPEPAEQSVAATNGMCVEEEPFNKRFRKQQDRVDEAFERARKEYPKTVYPGEREVFRRTIRTDADIGEFFSVLEVYKQSGPVRRGKIFSLTNYLKNGAWCTLPKEPLEERGKFDRLERMARGEKVDDL